MTQPIEPGAMAFLTRDSKDLYNGRERRKGFEFEVEELEVDTGEHKGDPDFIQGDYYMGHTPGNWSDVCIPAADVALLRTKEEMDARALPELEDLVDWLGSSLSDFQDTGSITEADMDKDAGEVDFFGRTPQGLAFTFTVKVTDIDWADE